MALPRLTTVLNKISSLATTIRGQATTVKAAFDHDVNEVKDYINDTLLPAIEDDFATTEDLQALVIGEFGPDFVTEEMMAAEMKKDVSGGVAGYDATSEALELKLDTANIANNLVTTVEGLALDARQGKVLKDGLDATNNTLASLFNSKSTITKSTAMNTIMNPGMYSYNTYGGTGGSNLPETAGAIGFVWVFYDSNGVDTVCGQQVLVETRLYFRRYYNATGWTAWKSVALS